MGTGEGGLKSRWPVGVFGIVVMVLGGMGEGGWGGG